MHKKFYASEASPPKSNPAKNSTSSIATPNCGGGASASNIDRKARTQGRDTGVSNCGGVYSKALTDSAQLIQP